MIIYTQSLIFYLEAIHVTNRDYFGELRKGIFLGISGTQEIKQIDQGLGSVRSLSSVVKQRKSLKISSSQSRSTATTLVQFTIASYLDYGNSHPTGLFAFILAPFKSPLKRSSRYDFLVNVGQYMSFSRIQSSNGFPFRSV